MITNVYPKYEPKTNWEYQTKVNMNIRDLQGKYPNGCQCCGNIYTRDKFSILVNSHFKTKKHQKRKSRYYKGLRCELSPQYLLA